MHALIPRIPVMRCCCCLARITNRAPDHEIFRLRDEIEADEGPGVTFYGASTPYP